MRWLKVVEIDAAALGKCEVPAVFRPGRRGSSRRRGSRVRVCWISKDHIPAPNRVEASTGQEHHVPGFHRDFMDAVGDEPSRIFRSNSSRETPRFRPAYNLALRAVWRCTHISVFGSPPQLGRHRGWRVNLH